MKAVDEKLVSSDELDSISKDSKYLLGHVSELIFLLRVVEGKRTLVDVCRAMGGNYEDVVLQVHNLVELGVISKNKGTLKLSENGILFLKNAENEIFEANNKYKHNYEIEEINLQELYKPSKKKFLHAMRRGVYTNA